MALNPKQDPIIHLDESTHTYYVGDRIIPGVTTILKPLCNYGDIPEYVLNKKATLGIAVHRATELYDDDNLDASTVHPHVEPYLDGWIKFKNDVPFEIVGSESIVYNERNGYAGKYDRKVIYKNVLSLFDIKCTAKLEPAVGPQLAAYMEANNSISTNKIQKRFAIQLKPDGTYRLQEYSDRSDFSTFLSCLNIYNWRLKHGYTS